MIDSKLTDVLILREHVCKTLDSFQAIKEKQILDVRCLFFLILRHLCVYLREVEKHRYNMLISEL